MGIERRGPRVLITPAGTAGAKAEGEPFALRLARKLSNCGACGNWAITVRHGVVTRVVDPEGATVYSEGQWRT